VSDKCLTLLGDVSDTVGAGGILVAGPRTSTKSAWLRLSLQFRARLYLTLV